jgi:hypothetical protein
MMSRAGGYSPILSFLQRHWHIPLIVLGPLLLDAIALSVVGCISGVPSACSSYSDQAKLALIATLHFVAVLVITPRLLQSISSRRPTFLAP